jgi:hypothetical protein
MQHQLDSINAQLAQLTAAAEYRHQLVLWHLQVIHAKLEQSPGHSWLKVPLALALPVAVFLLMWAITGDARKALNAAKLAG